MSTDNLSSQQSAVPREMKLQLHIKQVHYVVQKETPVQVVWTRGNKNAKTKKRVLTETTPYGMVDEKFQIVTMFDVDPETLKPCKPKNSFLTVMTDSKSSPDGKGVLGKVELDIS